MWADPAGRRRLLAPSPEVADYIASVYFFDEVAVTAMTVTLAENSLDLYVAQADLDIHLDLGRGLPWAPDRPLWFTEHIEAPIARRCLGVQVTGVSPTGVRQWYQATGIRRVTGGWAALGDCDLGAIAGVDPPVRFGFSEPPRWPSSVKIKTTLSRL